MALLVATRPCTELYKLGIVFSFGFVDEEPWWTRLHGNARELTGTHVKKTVRGEKIVDKRV